MRKQLKTLRMLALWNGLADLLCVGGDVLEQNIPYAMELYQRAIEEEAVFVLWQVLPVYSTKSITTFPVPQGSISVPLPKAEARML